MRECESKLYRRIAGGNKEKRGQACTVKRSGPSVGQALGFRHCQWGVVLVLVGEIRAVSGRNRRSGKGAEHAVFDRMCRMRIVFSEEKLGGVGQSRHTVSPAFVLRSRDRPLVRQVADAFFPASRSGSAEYS